MEFLTGKDYPHLCSACQATIDQVALLFNGDQEDTEAPCMFVYDHRMFCGGLECVNKAQDADDYSDTAKFLGFIPAWPESKDK